jgi:DNA-binding MarR family transcriptional regulator
MTRLTETQLVVLSEAANREDGSILPLPKSIKGGAAAKVVDALIRRGLAERIESDRPAIPDRVRITRAGLEAIGVEPEAGAEAVTDARDARPEADTPKTNKKTTTRRREGTKQALLIDLLRRPEGATIEQIAEATGWQRHTVRGAIAGALKKKLGLTVESEKVEGVGRVYRIAP